MDTSLSPYHHHRFTVWHKNAHSQICTIAHFPLPFSRQRIVSLFTNRIRRAAHILSYTHKRTPQKHMDSVPTIFSVQVDLHFPLLWAQQGLRHLGNGQSLRVGSIQKVTRARLLHDLSTGVTTHVAEAVIAEDDRAVFDSCICDDKFATCGWSKKGVYLNKIRIKSFQTSLIRSTNCFPVDPAQYS